MLVVLLIGDRVGNNLQDLWVVTLRHKVCTSHDMRFSLPPLRVRGELTGPQ